MKNLGQFLNFSVVARHGSFAQAARELGLAPSSVAKSVARLEKDLGARLFHRTTRALTLTEEGRTLYAKCELLVAQIDALDLTSLGGSDEPAGMLRIGAPIGYGVRIVLPLLARLRERHPALEFDLRLSDGRVSLLDEGFDAVIRFGELEDSSLIAHKIDEQPLVLCASPAYLYAPSHTYNSRSGPSHRRRVPSTDPRPRQAARIYRERQASDAHPQHAVSHQPRRGARRSGSARHRNRADAPVLRTTVPCRGRSR